MIRLAKMKTVTSRGTRLDQLKALAKLLADSMDQCEDARALPALAKELEQTLRRRWISNTGKP